MPETKESLLKIINASGFLFQLRIEQEIKSTDLARIWDISAREHRWYDSQEGSDGFMDLVLTQTGSARIVIECKRVTNANWIFLIPDNKDRVLNAQIKWTMRIKPDKYFTDWQDFKVRPVSPEATFCIVRGQGEKDTPMLERVSSLLLRSIEYLAHEEFTYTDRGDKKPYLYFPVIITNATLHVCRFDPQKIDINKGQINAIDDIEFEIVPCVRFRKNFSSTIDPSKLQKDLETTNRSNERTIFVINSESLTETLSKWDTSYKVNYYRLKAGSFGERLKAA
ncbi:MAG: hypothetical protein ABSA23_18490 [Anaerolineales bacterium]|jgi:hypothetical protein